MKKPASGSVLDRDREVVNVSGREGKVDFTLDDKVALPRVEDGLRQYLTASRGWFTGGAVTVNAGRRVLKSEELGRLRQVLEGEFQLSVATFWCQTEVLEEAISEEAGVPFALGLRQRPSGACGEEPRPREAPLFVKSTCRSGTVIQHNGDVIVLGDVNPGAEVTATGDIIVLGKLRGIAHAGASSADATSAVIIALSLRPLQLRIGGHLCIGPSDETHGGTSAQPEIAYVAGQSMVVAPFTGRLERTLSV